MDGSSKDGRGVSGLDGPISQYLNRPVSRAISPLVAGLPVTPDQISWLSFGLVVAGGAAFSVRLHRLGGLLVHVGSVADGVDGEVARLQGTASASGALLDLALDRVADVILLAGLARGAGGRQIDWLLALAAANGALTASVVKERFGSEGESPAELQRAEATEGWRATMARFTGRDGRLFAATLAGLLGQPRLGLVWLAYSSNARLIDRVIAARLLLRRRDGETSAPSDEAAGG